jgi:hypothetical protein
MVVAEMAIVLCVLLPYKGMSDEFFDDFDDDNIDDWEEAGDKNGKIEVVDGQILMEATGARTMLLAPEYISVKNFTVTVDIKIETHVHGPLVWRYQDPQNFYGVEQRAVKIRFRMGDTAFPLKENVNQQVGQYVRHKVVAENDKFTVYRGEGRDEEELHELVDGSLPNAGRIGIGVCLDRGGANYRTFFDNFRVESDELKLSPVDSAGKLSVTWGRLKARY